VELDRHLVQLRVCKFVPKVAPLRSVLKSLLALEAEAGQTARLQLRGSFFNAKQVLVMVCTQLATP
jgi:hypothetical protein